MKFTDTKLPFKSSVKIAAESDDGKGYLEVYSFATAAQGAKADAALPRAVSKQQELITATKAMIALHKPSLLSPIGPGSIEFLTNLASSVYVMVKTTTGYAKIRSCDGDESYAGSGVPAEVIYVGFSPPLDYLTRMVKYFAIWPCDGDGFEVDGEHIYELDCIGRGLKAIDVTKATELTSLACSYNDLECLDLTGLVNLQYLDCSYNNLKELDVTDSNDELLSLACNYNQLERIVVTGSNNTTHIVAMSNKLTSVDLSGCTNLGYISLSYNLIETVTGLDDCFPAPGPGSGGIDLSHNSLSAEQIETIYADLPSAQGLGYCITVFGCPGSDDADQAIALAKGWSVVS